MSARDELIAGLRALADFYENNPTMPTDGFASVLVSCCTITGNDDAAAAALVEHAAELMGTPVSRRNGHTSTERKFHGVSLRPYATTRASMARYHAEQSYAGAVEPDGSAS